MHAETAFDQLTVSKGSLDLRALDMNDKISLPSRRDRKTNRVQLPGNEEI